MCFCWVCFLELCLVKTARNAARFSICFFWLVVWGGRLAFWKSSLCLRGGSEVVWDQTVSPNPGCFGCLFSCLSVAQNAALFWVRFFHSGCRCWFFMVVKVLSVLGWLIMTSFGWTKLGHTNFLV